MFTDRWLTRFVDYTDHWNQQALRSLYVRLKYVRGFDPPQPLATRSWFLYHPLEEWTGPYHRYGGGSCCWPGSGDRFEISMPVRCFILLPKTLARCSFPPRTRIPASVFWTYSQVWRHARRRYRLRACMCGPRTRAFKVLARPIGSPPPINRHLFHQR